MAADLRVEQDSSVELSVADGRLIVEPVGSRIPNPDDLLAGITPENLHEEIEADPQQGTEAW